MSSDNLQFSSLLSSIGVHTKLADLNKTIANLRVTANKSALPTTAANEELATSVADLEAQVESLTEQLELAATQLARYEQLADEQLPLLISTAEASIYDYKTAVDATANYTIDWFTALLLSENAKVELASKLYSLVSKYTNSNIDVISAVARRDPYIVARIMSPYVD